MSHGGWRPHIESALKLSLPELMRKGSIVKGEHCVRRWAWSRDGEPLANLSFVAYVPAEGDDEPVGFFRLIYTAGNREGERQSYDYRITLTASSMRFGGRRWWFRCPYTDRRCLTLFKFAGIDKFCSRTAVRPIPTYACQRGSKLEAIQIRRRKLRTRLGCGYGHDDPLDRPQWMRHRTFERIFDMDAELAEAEDVAFLGHLGNLVARLERKVS